MAQSNLDADQHVGRKSRRASYAVAAPTHNGIA
jgi:hypothetical protein